MSKLVSLALVALAAVSAVSGSPVKVSPSACPLFSIYPQTFHSPIILTSREELTRYLPLLYRPLPNPLPLRRLQAMIMTAKAMMRMIMTATAMLIASMPCIRPFLILPPPTQLPLPAHLPLPTPPSHPHLPM